MYGPFLRTASAVESVGWRASRPWPRHVHARIPPPMRNVSYGTIRNSILSRVPSFHRSRAYFKSRVPFNEILAQSGENCSNVSRVKEGRKKERTFGNARAKSNEGGIISRISAHIGHYLAYIPNRTESRPFFSSFVGFFFAEGKSCNAEGVKKCGEIIYFTHWSWKIFSLKHFAGISFVCQFRVVWSVFCKSNDSINCSYNQLHLFLHRLLSS